MESKTLNLEMKQDVQIETGKNYSDLDIPNEETKLAIEEGRRIARDRRVASYDNLDDLRDALDIENK